MGTHKDVVVEKLVVYAWPGGYPVFYIDGNQCVLCPSCAQEAIDDHEDGHWLKDLPVAYDVNWENPHLHCECGERIESAYAEED